jgi:crossover junction endodeoxyribonuclease RuvC
MNILGLDLSLSSTGFNVIDDNEKIITYGIINTEAKKNTEFERIYIIAKKCKELILEYNVDYVICENSFFGGNANTGIKLARLLGGVAYAVVETGKEIDLIAPTAARKVLLGSGKSNKEDVAEWIREHHIDLGVYSNKTVKSKGIEKNSDVYDSFCVSYAWLKQHKLNDKYSNK